jgi:repressor LexA
LAGRVAAGAPLEAIENVEHLSLTGCFGGGDDLFALEVSGQSMVNEDIREGDYVICRRSGVAQNGQLVVAIVDEQDATLKRFYKEADRVRLQPANDDYQPIYSNNCRIEAVVIGLVRKL